jgi:Chemotaxis response regulator containing a CheY-like receiver domain and a methylesterase domain
LQRPDVYLSHQLKERFVIKVVVVDDSAFMRKAISTMLAKDPEIDVVATARDGEEGLSSSASTTRTSSPWILRCRAWMA